MVIFFTISIWQIFTYQVWTVTINLRKICKFVSLFFLLQIKIFLTKWFYTFFNSIILNRHWNFQEKCFKGTICFIWGSKRVGENHQSWKTGLVTKLCIRQKTQKHPLKQKFWTKKNMTSKIFGMRSASCLKFPKKNSFWGGFWLFFFYKGKPYFECIKAEYFRWN